MAFPRGQVKILTNPAPTGVDDMIRIVATPSFFVALSAAETNALLALADIEERLAHIYDNAQSLWTGDDFCEIDDSWDVIHRIVNQHPPVESFEWEIGAPPQKYVIMGTSQLVEGCTNNELNLVSADTVGPIAQALAAIDRKAFFAGYQAHCPRGWDNFGEGDCDFCWKNFVKLKRFYDHHAGTGKNLVFAVEY